MKLRKWGNSFFSPPLHVDAPTWQWRVMEQPTTQGPPRMLADQNPSFSTEGKGLSPPHEPNLKQTSEQRYVPKSFTNNLCPSTSSWTPKIFSEQLASYFGRPLGVGDYYGLQNRVSLYASPDSLASHFRVNNPTGGCSSRERQNGLARSHPPSLLQHRRGVRQQYISSRQEGRWPLPGYKPKESEFLCALPAFQNGGNSHVTGSVKKKGDFMVKLDLKDAYFTVLVWKGHQKFLRFIWKETLWEFACLPFGLASAPRTFTKIRKPVVATLRNLGIRLIIYLDDLLILADSEQTARLHLATAMNLLESLGFIINLKKSVLAPVHKIEFLGLSVDSVTLCLALPRDKVTSICRECEGLIANPVATVRQLAHLGSVELLHSSSVPCPTLLPLLAAGKDPSTPLRRPL